QNLRVINKRVNYYKNSPNSIARQNTDNGQKENWAIRRSLGKDTFYGKTTINGVDKITLRTALDTSFDSKKINSISDTVRPTKTTSLNTPTQIATVALPFDEAILPFGALSEKQELEAIIPDADNEIGTTEELFGHLKTNKFQ